MRAPYTALPVALILVAVAATGTETLSLQVIEQLKQAGYDTDEATLRLTLTEVYKKTGIARASESVSYQTLIDVSTLISAEREAGRALTESEQAFAVGDSASASALLKYARSIAPWIQIPPALADLIPASAASSGDLAQIDAAINAQGHEEAREILNRLLDQYPADENLLHRLVDLSGTTQQQTLQYLDAVNAVMHNTDLLPDR